MTQNTASHFSLDGQKALITGGASGIGRAVAERYIAAGASVAIVGRRADGEQIAQEIGAQFYRTDVTDEAAQHDLFQQFVDEKLDILVLNAGIGDAFPSVAQTPSEGMRRLIETNVIGVFLGLKYGSAALREGGAIICTSSSAAHSYLPGLGPYGASKQTVDAMARAAAMELGPRNICVNAICPGGFASEMAPYDADHDREIGRFTALGRGYMSSTELVGLYHLLAAPEGRFITGQALRVDGGFGLGYGAHLMTSPDKA